jgi:two-component system phosphate regulon sensor histidine kinase PhoR
VRGFAELLATGQLGPLRPEQEQPVEVIYRRIQMLSKIVEDLTVIMEAETAQIHREVVDLAAMVRELAPDFSLSFAEAALTLNVTAEMEVAQVIGDPIHLRRVLDNLLGNARKFTPAGGMVEVRLWHEAERLLITVADTGIGIPENQLERVFERFYQVDGSMTRRYGGTGLGLALVKEIIEAHGGHISVRSHVGKGSTFTVELPLLKDAA